jgi:hypothetical protein
MVNRPVPPIHARRWAWWGAGIGACVPFLFLGPELLRRVVHVAQGGRGETAVWGEPLFYIAILALPLAALGYAVGKTLEKRMARPGQSPGTSRP